MVNTSHTTSFEKEIDYIYASCAFLCVIFAASAAGMTTGLLSIDTLKLKIRLEVGTDAEKRQAQRILPVIANHHFLLCTLLIYNAAATEALPIFLDALVPSWAAVVISVTLVLVFGEIIPTALFTGPNQLAIASWFTSKTPALPLILPCPVLMCPCPAIHCPCPLLHSTLSHTHAHVTPFSLPGLVYLLQIVLYPVAYPMALLLDWMLGHEESAEIFTREELSAMMQIIRNNAMSVKYMEADLDEDEDAEEPLSTNEVKVITGVLGLAKMSIRDVCVPMAKVNMLSSEQVFDRTTIEAIDKCGHSRLPVFNGADTTDIKGFFLVKRLISINPEMAVPLASIPLQQPLVVGAGQSLLDVLTVFQMGHSHMALVSEEPEALRVSLERNQSPSASAAPIGILSIEDIFEAMLQSEIFDEEDREKGQYQEEASLALREMSLRSTTPSMSLPTGFGYELAAAAAEGGPPVSRSFNPMSSRLAASPPFTGAPSASASPGGGARPTDKVSGGRAPGEGEGDIGDIEQTTALRRAMSDGPGRALRALSEAIEGRKRRHNFGADPMHAGTGASERSWINARASTRSVGSALHASSAGHFSDGSISAPLLSEFDAEQGRASDQGIGRKVARGKITPSIVTKYVARRQQQSRDRTYSK